MKVRFLNSELAACSAPIELGMLPESAPGWGDRVVSCMQVVVQLELVDDASSQDCMTVACLNMGGETMATVKVPAGSIAEDARQLFLTTLLEEKKIRPTRVRLLL